MNYMQCANRRNFKCLLFAVTRQTPRVKSYRAGPLRTASTILTRATLCRRVCTAHSVITFWDYIRSPAARASLASAAA